METSGGQGGRGGRTGASGLSAAASAREAGKDFSASFARLRHVIDRSCARHGEWQAQIAGGVQASLDFAAACPESARALTLQARRSNGQDGHSEEEVIAYLTARLAHITPSQKPLPICTDEAIVESIATVVRGHLQRGSAEELPEAAPDLIYFALVPYAGMDEARKWTELFLPVSALYGT